MTLGVGALIAVCRAGAQVVADCGVIDPEPELAKRIKLRLEIGEPYETALRQSIDDVLVEGRRNSE